MAGCRGGRGISLETTRETNVWFAETGKSVTRALGRSAISLELLLALSTYAAAAAPSIAG